MKSLLDAFTHAGLYDDDSQVYKLTIIKREPLPPGGMAYVRIKEWNARLNTGERCKIVQDYLKNLENETERTVCFFYLNNYTDAEIRKRLHLLPRQLDEIKDSIGKKLLDAGIRF